MESNGGPFDLDTVRTVPYVQATQENILRLSHTRQVTKSSVRHTLVRAPSCRLLPVPVACGRKVGTDIKKEGKYVSTVRIPDGYVGTFVLYTHT